MKEGKSGASRLGRGLSELLSDLQPQTVASATEPSAVGGTRTIPIELLSTSPFQPRRDFNTQALEDLANSVRAKGVLQPLLVRPVQDGTRYEIVAGERRWRAAQIAGLHEVPVIVRDFADNEAAEIALIENVQRSDLNPVEEAAGYRDLIERFNHTQEALSEIVGKSRSHIANSMRLLKLPSPVLSLLAAGAISAGHARALIGTPEPARLAAEIIKRGLNVRQTEKMAQGAMSGGQKSRSATARRAKDADTQSLEAELSANIGMKVKITHHGGSECGTLSISYTTLDDLDLLCRVLAAIPGASDL